MTQTSQAGLAARLGAEHAARPTGGAARAEGVLTALEAAGVKIAQPQQYLGTSVKATYCIGGRTGSGLAVAVCEYPDAVAARAGRSVSLKKFAGATNREVHVRGALTLTLTGSGAAEEKARALAAFEQKRP